MNTLKFYKCVSVYVEPEGEDKMGSVVAYGRAYVRYVYGRTIRAPKWLADKGYHLLVFKTRAMAKRAMNRFDWDGVIVAVRVREDNVIPKSEVPPMLDPETLENGKIEKADVRGWPKNTGWPSGTVMVKALRLIRNKGE